MKYNVKRLCFLLDFGWCYMYLDIVCSEQGVGMGFFLLNGQNPIQNSDFYDLFICYQCFEG